MHHRPLELFSHARIASPCSVAWNSMSGDFQKRRCPRCKLDVYNPVGMTEERCERLRGARLYVRSDGTFMPLDCPIGARHLNWCAFFVSGGCVLAILGWLLATVTLASEPHGSRHLRLGVPDADPAIFTINAVVMRWLGPAPNFLPGFAGFGNIGHYVPILQADWERAWLAEHTPLFDDHAHDMALKWPEIGAETLWNQREIAALDLLNRSEIQWPRPPPITPDEASNYCREGEVQ